MCFLKVHKPVEFIYQMVLYFTLYWGSIANKRNRSTGILDANASTILAKVVYEIDAIDSFYEFEVEISILFIRALAHYSA